MTDFAIRVEGLGKRYRIGARQAGYKTLRESLTGLARTPLAWLSPNGREPREDNAIWALRDVSFEVKPGEVLGIIGRNGAGKSTLLKILSRITEPTEGEIEILGRVGSLLEVGTGFHPELTGRENIFLRGAVLGMRRQEIRRKFDEIVEFAEVEKFVDTPVKHYSSGMYVRLAFAVAAHLEPEILLVDEVLAVGDAAFQKKCLGKMGAVASEGRTVLFVSHSMSAILGLCSRAILVDQGGIVEEGSPQLVVARHLKSVQGRATEPLAHRSDRRGNGALRFTEVGLTAISGERADNVLVGGQANFVLRFATHNGQPVHNVAFSFTILNAWGQAVTTCWTEYTGQLFESLPPCGEVVCEVPRFPFVPGTYTLRVAARVQGQVADSLEDAFGFDVIEGDFYGTGKRPKSVSLCLVPHSWRLASRAFDLDPGAHSIFVSKSAG